MRHSNLHNWLHNNIRRFLLFYLPIFLTTAGCAVNRVVFIMFYGCVQLATKLDERETRNLDPRNQKPSIFGTLEEFI